MSLYGSILFRRGGSGFPSPPPPPPPPPPPSTPSVSLTAPTDGGTSTALPVTATASATANSPASSIASVQFRLNGVTVATDSSGPPWSADLNPDNGTYSFDAVATDNLGGVATSATRTHTVAVSPPAGTVLRTFAINNPSGSTQPADFVTEEFGLAFKDADIAAGTYPQLDLPDSTPVAANFMLPTYYPSGCMKFASCIARIPVAIAAGGSQTVRLKTGGSTPTASALTNSDISSFSDIDVRTTARKNWTGTMTARLNQGLTDAGVNVQVLGTGPVGRLLVVHQEFNDGTSDHPNGGVDFYVYQLQSAAGGKYGLRVSARMRNGWHDDTTLAIATLCSDSLALRNSGSAVATTAPFAAARTFTRTGSDATCSNISELPTGMAVRVTNSGGALPAGLTDGETYFVRNGGSFIQLHSTIDGATDNSGKLSLTTDGTGAHTLTPLVQIAAYGAGPFVCESNGRYTFIAGGGSGVETSCRVSQTVADIIATKIVGPLRTDITPTILTTRTYNTDTYYDYLKFEDTTGERADIGFISGYALRDFLRGSDRLDTCRVHALQQGLKTRSVQRKATRVQLSHHNSTYSGMGTSLPTYRLWSSGSSGANVPTDYNVMHGLHFSAHRPSIQPYVYLMTGDPRFLDILLDTVGWNLGALYDRNPVVSATTYRNVVLNDVQQRIQAWSLRDIAWAATFTPTTYKGAALGTYLADTLASNADYYAALWATASSFAQTNRVPPVVASVASQQLSMWQTGYLISAMTLAYKATGDVDLKTTAERLLVWWDALRTNTRMFYLGSYYIDVSTGALSVAAWDEITFRGVLGNIDYAAANDTITPVSIPSGGGTIANGDRLLIAGFASSLGLTDFQRYFFRDASGTAGKLSTVAGLSDLVDITGSGTNFSSDFVSSYLANASNTAMQSRGFAKSYEAIVVGVVRWASAEGFTLPAGLLSALNTEYGSGPADFASDPVYALSSSY